MRADRIMKLADFVETTPYEFKMSQPWAQPQCGTAGCIAGHAAVLWPEVRMSGRIIRYDDDKLKDFLGIDEETATRLFYPGDYIEIEWEDFDEDIRYQHITQKGAAATLRRLAVTGEVKWYRTEQKR